MAAFQKWMLPVLCSASVPCAEQNDCRQSASMILGSSQHNMAGPFSRLLTYCRAYKRPPQYSKLSMLLIAIAADCDSS